MNKGITLIEILVAVSIMTVIFGVGIVAYQKVSRRQALDQATAGVVQTLFQAQTNALSGKKQNCGATNLAGWQVRFASANYTLEELCTTGSGYVTKTVSYSGQTTRTYPTPNPILYRVLNRGTNISSSTNITLNASSQIQTITVNSSGETSIGGILAAPSPTPCSRWWRCRSR